MTTASSAQSKSQQQQPDVTSFDKLIDREEIGQGGFGKVYKARHRDWGPVAYKELVIKFINSSDRIANELKQEVSVHIKLRHPNIVTLMAMVFEPEHYGVVLEYCTYGDVYKFLQLFPVDWAWKLSLAYDISLGMNYLHTQQRPIIHGDLKVKNVLVGDGYRAKISDFGLARWKQYSFEVTHMFGQGGTVTHVPPESWKNINSRRNEKYDVYGYGVLVWELLAHPKRPFEQVDSATIKSDVVTGHRPPFTDIPSDVPQFMKNVIDECWAQEPDNRPMFSVVKEKLDRHLELNKSQVEGTRVRLQQHEYQLRTTPRVAPNVSAGCRGLATGDAVSVRTNPAGPFEVVDNSQSLGCCHRQQPRTNLASRCIRQQPATDLGHSVRTNQGPIEVHGFDTTLCLPTQATGQLPGLVAPELGDLMDTESSTLTGGGCSVQQFTSAESDIDMSVITAHSTATNNVHLSPASLTDADAVADIDMV
jgi:serine/threonine protein kinase